MLGHPELTQAIIREIISTTPFLRQFLKASTPEAWDALP